MLAGESLARLLGEWHASGGEPPIPRSAREWRGLVDEASRHGVAPLLHRRLQALGARAAAPAACVQRLQIAYCHNALRQRTVREELRRILLALRHDGIRVVLLKGAYLAEAVYGDPALRPMVDIDLLVAPADLGGVEQRLVACGYDTATPSTGTDYTTHQHTHPFEKPGAVPIEVHRGMVPTDAPFDVDLDGLWARARPVRVGDVDALALSPADLIQHLCVHVAYIHQFDASLLSLHDIGAAVGVLRAEIDWGCLAATANRDGTSRFVFAALALVQATLGTRIPTDALDALDHGDADVAVVRAACDLLLANRAVELPAAYRTLRHVDGFAPRARAVASAIWPSRDRMRAIYGLSPQSRAVYAYYALRPLDLLRRRGGVVGGMLLRAPRLRPTLAREEARRIVERWIDRPALLPLTASPKA